MSDIWIQMRAGDSLFAITDGKADGSGHAYPAWNADASKLAMLRIERGNRKSIAIWDSRTRKLDTLPIGEPVLSFKWVTDDTLMVSLSALNYWDTIQRAPTEWAKADAGREPSISILQSGIRESADEPFRSSSLATVNVRTGRVTKFDDVYCFGFDLAPGGRTIACQVRLGIRGLLEPPELKILDFTGQIRFPSGGMSKFLITGPVRWSANGSEIAFVGRELTGAPTMPDEDICLLYRLEIASKRLTRVDLSQWHTPRDGSTLGLEWTDSGDLILRAGLKDAPPGSKPRQDWWLVTPDSARLLTEQLDQVPIDVIQISGTEMFAGMANDVIARFSTAAASPAPLPLPANLPGVYIHWPRLGLGRLVSPKDWAATSKSGTEVILGTRSDLEHPRYFKMNIRTGDIEELVKPASDAYLRQYEGFKGVTVFEATGRSGTRVWRMTASVGKAERLVSANEFLQTIAEGEVRVFDYLSNNGESLHGSVVLPSDYVAGRHYPLVSWVYSGQTIDGDLFAARQGASIADRSTLNVQILAAQGYAVLVPTMPRAFAPELESTLATLPNGVMPAINKLIAEGIADPNRFFIMGHSFGGFTTSGLITLTNRFKAAAALAGHSNFVSSFGSLDARVRYRDNVLQGSLHYGAPIASKGPWRDLGNYARNSPIFHVDRIKTPLLLIHGDMDFVPMQQADEMFMSLRYLDKRAQYVRYWGEGHVLESPANIRDMWSRIFAWFDEFGDIARSADGALLWEENRVASRKGKPALRAEDYLKIKRFFAPVGPKHRASDRRAALLEFGQ